MEKAVLFDNKAVIDLFTEGLISAPLTIQADLGDHCISATLTANGILDLGDKEYPNLQQAMNATHRESESTSDAWQFWTWFSEERQAWTPLEHLRATLAARDTQSELRTSDSHPLRIDSVAVPNTTGRIGLTFCPGKRCEGLYGGTWARDLDKDLTAIEHWGSKALISLMEDHEFPILGVPEFADTLSSSAMIWHQLPIQDMQPPNERFEQQWAKIGPQLHQLLADGHSIVIHCRGGLGRTGLLAARILVEVGLDPVDAIAEVRKARTHSIETYAQEHYVLTERWKSRSTLI